MYLSRMTSVHKDRNLAICPLHLESVPDMLLSPELVFAHDTSPEKLASLKGKCSATASHFRAKTAALKPPGFFSQRQAAQAGFAHRNGHKIWRYHWEKHLLISKELCNVEMCSAWSWLGLKHSTFTCILEKLSLPDGCCSYKEKETIKQRPGEIFSVLRGRSPLKSKWG